MAKMIKKKSNKNDEDYYANDPLFQLLSKVMSQEQMELLKENDRKNREKERRNARFKKYY